MQKDQTQSSSQIVNSPSIACRHLRCKEMYYDSPQPADEMSDVYWCGKTQEVMGPDGKSCSKCECGPERACYQD
jgi:hypothetical protein